MSDKLLVKLQKIIHNLDKRVWCDSRIEASTREASGLSAEEIKRVSISLIADTQYPEKVH